MTQRRIAIELEETLAARLAAAAGQAGMSAEALAAAAIARAVADLEDWAEDEAAYAEYALTGEAIPLASMEAWVKSWGTAGEATERTCPNR